LGKAYTYLRMLKRVLFCAVAVIVTGQKGYGNNLNGNLNGNGKAISGKSATPVVIGGNLSQVSMEKGFIQGLSHQPSAAAKDALLDIDDAVLLLIDHQSGLFQTVKDVPLRDLRANTVALAKVAELVKIPIFTTASEPNGPNGPLMDELAEAAPSAQFIARKGEVSAWDNEDFIKAVEATGKKTLIIAGVWTSVCVAFPALEAKADGFKVFAVMDASGDMSEMSSKVTLSRLSHAGVITVTTNVIMAECQRSWNRADAMQWGALYNELVPHYKALGESFMKAQSVALNQSNSIPAGATRVSSGASSSSSRP